MSRRNPEEVVSRFESGEYGRDGAFVKVAGASQPLSSDGVGDSLEPRLARKVATARER